MRSKLSSILFILCIVLCNACDRDVIKIGIVGDQFGAYSADESYAIMEKGVDRLLALSPDIVLHVGDMVETIRGINSFEDYESNFRTATGIMERFSCPWLLAVGDHDVVPPEFKALSGDRSREKWFMDLIRETDLPIGERPYYSYDHKGYHFIVLYSIENMHTDPRWGSIYLNKISEEQLKWLEKDLRRSAKSKGNIVLVHHPHWYVWQNWQPVHDLLKSANTHAVIAGHYHYDQDEGCLDGIRYLVMGSTGGVIKETDLNTGSQEIALLTLDKKGIVAAQLFDVETNAELEWTPRSTMDRVQALSCMLDNLWQDEDLYSDQKALYTRDGAGNYVPVTRIGLESLSNPLDVPLTVRIEPAGDAFRRTYWVRHADTSSCPVLTLAPGERSGWANYATVGNWYVPAPLWLGELKEDAASGFQSLDLDLVLTFTDTKQREIRKRQSYYFKARN